MQNLSKFGAFLALICLFLMSFSHKVEAKTYNNADNTVCYAQAGYHEARGEGKTAMGLVMAATYNRVVDSRWRKSACGVVWQRGQYAWTLEAGHRMSQLPKATAPADRVALAEALSLARSLRAGKWEPSISANHFLSPDALSGGHWPRWARCPAGAATGECVVYKGRKVRSPDFTYNGTWFYTL